MENDADTLWDVGTIYDQAHETEVDWIGNVKLGPRPVPNNGKNAFVPWRLCGCGIMCPTTPCYQCTHPVQLDEAEQARVDAIARQLPGGSVDGNWRPPARPLTVHSEMGVGHTMVAVACMVLVMGGVTAYVFNEYPRPRTQVQLD